METLYLDTHIVLWLFESRTKELSKKAIGLINENDLYIYQSIKINWTRDVFDRIIVAQASIGDHKLLTRDRNILKHYKHAVW